MSPTPAPGASSPSCASGPAASGMSENVEVKTAVVRRWLGAFENDTDAFRDCLDPKIEWYPIEEDNTPNLGVEAAE